MLAGAALVGVLLDQTLRAPAFGLAASATLVSVATLLAFTGPARRLEPRVLLGVAAGFSLWLFLRASPWLLWPDLAASVLLIGIAASVSARGSIFDVGFTEVAARAANAVAHIAVGIGFLFRPLAAARSRLKLIGPVARGFLIGVPILALLCTLLASADPVFASFFKLGLDPMQLLSDALFMALGVVAVAGIVRLAHAEEL